jgi:hypothetical protein
LDNQAPLSPSLPERPAQADRKRPLTPRTTPAARSAARREGPAGKPATDWQAGSGLVDQMLAYSDWWNIPAPKIRSPPRG